MPAVSQSRQPSARVGPDVPTSAALLVIVFALLAVLAVSAPDAFSWPLRVQLPRLVPRRRRAA
jgi:hypothetical protein